jgi:hypothetical protein
MLPRGNATIHTYMVSNEVDASLYVIMSNEHGHHTAAGTSMQAPRSVDCDVDA